MTNFLMVITDVNEETGIVTLASVHDWEPPCHMFWYYANPTQIMDKVGQSFRVRLQPLAT